MLYKHKAGEGDRTDFLLDRWFLLASLMLPFWRFAVSSFYPGMLTVAFVWILDQLLLTGYAVLAALFAFRQVRKHRAGVPLNVPKLMLLAAVVPLQWVALRYAATASDGIVRAGIILGLFHSFQYHRLMWFHNHNRYTGGKQNTARA